MIQKQLQHKENTTRLYPEDNPRKHSEESEQSHYNFQLNLKKKNKYKRNMLTHCKQNRAMPGAIL
jgi:hypothetical protein